MNVARGKFLVLLPLGALVIAACGGGGGTEPADTTGAATTTTTTTTTSLPTTTTTVVPTTTTTTLTFPYDFTQHPGTPLITPGAWDPGYTAVPHVVQHDGEWLMFYSGGTGGRSSALGLARSADGLMWEKSPDQAIFEGPGRGVSWNYARLVGDEWVMWYTTGYTLGYRRLNRATAPAPEGPWTEDELTIEDPSNEWNDRILPTGFSQIGESYLIPYAGFPDGVSPPSIGLLRSPDGETWQSTEDPIYRPQPGTWTEYGVVPTNIVETPAGLELFFLGFDRPVTIAIEAETLKLGRLVSTDGGATWEADNDGQPVIDTFERGWPGISVVYLDGEYRLYMGHELGGAGIALITGMIP
ncbi:MAG: hypothetical protein HKN74_07830 [Acidimicrobiia bacterium]|nr:hypothetical protein [Acidimicrobiia bacterium]MBT8217367.1 hypothetical protein [Acidimicrobiia bacterium]NNF10177.1 hypothetical protein [Acidimicrobiia bacterium]NNL69073.1 hypothetical protein [Acidimicrobiia bacterium]